MSVFSQWSSPEYWMGVLYSIPAVFLALSFHECAHAFVAYKCGDPTARNLGRMTLDPTKHLDLWGTICFIFFRFGWAKPVPVNPRNFKHPRRDDILVSLAGIITNFILSFIAYFILFLFYAVLGFQNEIFVNIMYYIIVLNITLGIFNILPIPPLDGFQIISTLFIKKASAVVVALNRYGFIILIVLLISGVLSGVLTSLMSLILRGYGMIFNFYI